MQGRYVLHPTEILIHQHLSYSDIVHDDPFTIAISIKASKTDPYMQGVIMYLGATGSMLWPIKALLAFIMVGGDATGPLFKFAKFAKCEVSLIHNRIELRYVCLE